MVKVLVILAEGNFRDSEYLVPRAFFEQNGFEVRTVSTNYLSIGKFGYNVENDFMFDTDFEELKEFDALYFVGGLGCLNLISNDLVKDLTKYYLDSNKLVSAVCAAPRLLLEWEVLNGFNCTGSNYDDNFETICKKFKAEYINKSVVSDRNIITGIGPIVLEELSLEIINKLKNR